jgi:sensor histidine kinase YesM
VLNTIARDKALGHTGIGLANVRERLEVQFGERARFTAGAAEEELWVAEIHMPLLRDGPDGARPEAGSGS